MSTCHDGAIKFDVRLWMSLRWRQHRAHISNHWLVCVHVDLTSSCIVCAHWHTPGTARQRANCTKMSNRRWAKKKIAVRVVEGKEWVNCVSKVLWKQTNRWSTASRTRHSSMVSESKIFVARNLLDLCTHTHVHNHCWLLLNLQIYAVVELSILGWQMVRAWLFV